METMTAPVASKQLVEMMQSARQRTLELLDGLTQEQLIGPKLPTVNPMLWEVGHVAWFHEYFILRRVHGAAPLLARGDQLYDSIAIAHDTRWDLPVYPLPELRDYMARVLDRLTARLPAGLADERDSFLYQFTTFHEDMHDEAFTWARQTLAYPTPRFAPDGSHDPYLPPAREDRRTPYLPPEGEGGAQRRMGDVATESMSPAQVASARTSPFRPFGAPSASGGRESLTGDAAIPGGRFRLGSPPDSPFLFDNEKWAHPVTVAPFRMARTAVSNAAFAAFVEDGGYRRASLWTDEGWRWRQETGAEMPVFWRRDASGGWQLRNFDRWVDLPPHDAVIHVNWYEAMAWCRWAGRRLPREAEWEFAATMRPGPDGVLVKGRYPWGDAPADASRANLDGFALGTIDVAALPEGDNAWGCRQLIGNVWEWTADTFGPFPGFAPDDYKEYSEPLFGSTKVLRGGAWTTRGRLASGTYRNYFGPERRDIFAGFRSCALA
jgi:iron(II)-dependent oxidoreductase